MSNNIRPQISLQSYDEEGSIDSYVDPMILANPEDQHNPANR